MAKTLLNSALKSIRGGLDAWVYRQYGDKLVVSPRPVHGGPPTAAQATHRERFRLAGAYARDTYADPARRAPYVAVARERGMPITGLMVTDFLKPPTVDAIDLSGYHGAVNDPIAITATDDVGVTAVTVTIQAADETVLEQGAAALTNGVWVYHATTARTAGQTVTITATAVDRPGHTGEKTESWS